MVVNLVEFSELVTAALFFFFFFFVGGAVSVTFVGAAVSVTFVGEASVSEPAVGAGLLVEKIVGEPFG